MIRILIADDHVVVPDGLRCLLARQKDIEVIGCVASGLDAVEGIPSPRYAAASAIASFEIVFADGGSAGMHQSGSGTSGNRSR